METIPLNIEQKIENLPVVPFDESEDFQKIILSQDFTDIFEYYKDNYLPDVLKTTSEIYQRVSLYLTLTNQDTSFIEQTDSVLYRRPCPTIEEFMENPRYFGLQGSSTYPYWRKQLYKIFAPDSSINRILWSGATGTGKSLQNQMLIPTPKGHVFVKDIKIGDYLWGTDGKPTRVLGVYPQGKLSTYKITFDDNTEVICSGNHIWHINANRRFAIKEKDITTEEMLKSGISGIRKGESKIRYKYTISVPKAVQYTHKDLPVDPYVLGFLLGDGHFNETCIITQDPKDTATINKIADILTPNYKLQKYGTYHYGIIKDQAKSGFINFIRELGLEHTNSKTKFIPDCYMYSDEEQRYELLRGLLDSDGTIQVGKNRIKPTVSFGTINEHLANQVADLVRSLGGRAKIIKNYRTDIKHKNSIYYTQYIVTMTVLKNPFYLPRKANKWTLSKIYNKVIKKIELTGESEECTCFEVEASDHLFLCNDYIITHNTVTARKAIIYALYRLLCLRYPRAVLNCEASSTLAVFILSVTQKTAYQTNFEPFVKILENMPCFQRVRNMVAFDNFDLENPRVPFPFYVDKANLTIVFKDNFILTIGSQISNTVGYDIVISGADEVNELGVSTGMELLNSIDGRVQGRFAGSPYILTNVMSSARATDSVTKEYVKKWKNDKNFLYLHPMRFEVKESADFNAGEKFIVQIGNGIIPSKIITDPGELKAIENNKYEIPIGCEIVKIPGIYKPQFESDIIQSIQDILGIDTKDTKNVFRDTSKLEDEDLCPELLFQANLGDNNDLFQILLDNTNLFKKNSLTGKYYLKRAPKAQRYVHCDLSSTGECDTGLSLLHKEYRVNPITLEKETLYIVDFIMAINAKNVIDLEAVEKFYKDLVTKGNVSINTITCDQYQSEVIRQNWEKSGLFGKVEKSSVDIKLEPYINAANLMITEQIKCGKCPKLKKELEALIYDKGKVTRTTELKDMADSLVGSIYNAQLDYNDTPTYEYIGGNVSNRVFTYMDYIDADKESIVDL